MQPAASAGADLRVGIAEGKFHGVIPAVTPIGSFVTRIRRSGQGVGIVHAVEALRLLAEPLVERGRVGDLCLRLRERLALLGDQQRGEAVGALHHQVGEPAEDPGALFRGCRLPAGQGALCGLDRAARLVGAHPGHLRDGLAGGRIDDCEGGAGVGVHPASVDVGLAAQEVALDCGHEDNDNRPVAAPQFVRFDDVRRFLLTDGVSGRPLFGEGAMLNLIDFEPGATVPLHSHPHEQLGIVLRGMQALVVDGVARELGPLEGYVLPGGVEHSAYCGPEGALVLDVFSPVREDYLERWVGEA